MKETITADELLNKEFGNPDEMPNQVEDREVDPVREIIAVTNEKLINDREVDPVKENNYVPVPRSSKPKSVLILTFRVVQPSRCSSCWSST